MQQKREKLEQTVYLLGDKLNKIKHKQQYLKHKERLHKNSPPMYHWMNHKMKSLVYKPSEVNDNNEIRSLIRQKSTKIGWCQAPRTY